MPHYLGGKLGRSSSRSIFPSVHFTSRPLPCTPPPPTRSPFSLALRSRPPRLKFADGKRSASVPSTLSLPFANSFSLFFGISLSLSLLHTCTLSWLPSTSLYTVHLRIGSLSTREPPPSPLPYGPIVVFSRPSLPPSPLATAVASPLGHSTTPILSVPSEQRERVTIYSGDLRDREARRPPCRPRAAKPPTFSISFENERERPCDRPYPYLPPPLRCASTPPFLLVLIPYSCVIYAGSG